MSVRITCPSCDKSYAVADDQRGEKIRCKYCKSAVAVPDDDGERVYDPKGKSAARRTTRHDDDDDRETRRRDRGRDRDDDDEPRQPEKKAKASQLPIILLAVGGVVALGFVLLVGVAFAIYFITKSDDNNAVPPPRIANNGPPPFPPPGGFQGGGPPINPGGGPDVPFVIPPANEGPGGPVQIDPATRDKVKAATVFMQVTMPNGMQASGSGFFAIEPGIVITNAHVLGMMQASSRPPTSVDVVVHSGEPNEKTLNGTVLGADRETDLAVVRVNDAGVPPPLPVHTATTLQHLQEVYFFGYPYGKKLGTEVSINRATVSSLRKGTNGALAEVQLTGDMQPGNSGGPVVDSQGRIVGIAVAIIRGTRMNFAVPADKIKPILDGRIEDSVYGDPYVVNNLVKLPVKLRCLDPLRRVKAMRVDVWSGPMGAPRPTATEPPAPLPGDGPHKTVTIEYKDGMATADVPLPAAKDGEAYWFQPVVVDGGGVTRWHTATPRNAAPPVERVGAELKVKLDEQSRRTIKVKDTIRMTIQDGKNTLSQALHFDATLLETVTPIAKGTAIDLSIGPNQFREEELFGKTRHIESRFSSNLHQLSPRFVADSVTGKLTGGNMPKVSEKLPRHDQDTFKMMLDRICNVFEQTSVHMPNRAVNALDSWPANVPMLVEKQGVKKVLDLNLRCVYLGTRVIKERREALISLAGSIRSRDKNEKDSLGDVSGRVVLDLDNGFLSSVRMTIRTEFDTGGHKLQIVVAEDIDLTRSPGNPENLAEVKRAGEAGNLPKKVNPRPPVRPNPKLPVKPTPPDIAKPNPMPSPKTNPPAPMGDRVVLDVKNALTKNDFIGGPRARKHKTYDVKMESGKTYVIEMKPAPTKIDITEINPFLQLLDPAGKEVAKDDDGGGGNSAKITFTAPQSGTFRVVATTMSGIQLGRYQLMVTAKE